MLIEQNMEIKLLMKINPYIISFAKVFIVIDLCLVTYALVFEDKLWLLNSQAAFVASLFVTLASFFSYKRKYF